MGSCMWKMLGLLCFLGCITYVLAQGGPPPSGDVTFVVVFTSPIYVCSDEQSVTYINPAAVEALMVDEETSILRGSMELLKHLEPDTMLEIKLEKEANGKMETVMTHELCNVCGEFGNEEGDYYKFLQYFGLPDSCPIEPGSYPIHDMMVDTAELPVNSANAGCYVANLNFYKSPDENCKEDNEFLACMKLEFCIEPL